MKKAGFIFVSQLQGMRPDFRLFLLCVFPLLIFSCVGSRPVAAHAQAFYIRSVPGAYTEDVTMEGEVKSMNPDTAFLVYLGWHHGRAPVIDTVWVSGNAFRAFIQKVPDGNFFIGTKRDTGDSIFLTASKGVRQYFRLDLAPVKGEPNTGKSGIIIKGLDRRKSFEIYIEKMNELSPGIRM